MIRAQYKPDWTPDLPLSQALELVSREHDPEAGPMLFVYEEGRTLILTRGSTPIGAPVQATMSSGDGRILLVEDDPALARSIQRVFKFEGLAIETARSCAEAERIIQGFECAIFDLNLPDGSGIELAQKAKEWVKHPVFYSATTDIGAVRQAQELGIFVSKANGLTGLRAALGL